ncbi:MAG: patatin-like phospholipase family protein [Phenylobacterium sp.]
MQTPPLTALARLFESARLAGTARWWCLPAGLDLFRPGEPAAELHLLRAGRLGAFRVEAGEEPRFLGIVRPGEPAGEMSLITGFAHSGRLTALRDSEVLSLDREAFFSACEADPDIMTDLARLMVGRARDAGRTAALVEPSVFGFVAQGPIEDLRGWVESLAGGIRAAGFTVAVAGEEAQDAETSWFSNLEHSADYALYVAGHGEAAWAAKIARQVDRLFRVGRGDYPPPPGAAAHMPVSPGGGAELILVQPPGIRRPRGAEAWMTATGAVGLTHVRLGDSGDTARLVRRLTGRAVGLVLSGGGARAYAHIGVIRALSERGVPIDHVGGASMGAVIAAGLALGWDLDELDQRIRRAFVASSPLDDIAFPMLAMTRGEKVARRLEEHFGDVQFADLWRPCFCVSSNLTTGAHQVHRRGSVRAALRASISLPGLLPPALQGQNVLVDGAVLKNLPVDVMRGGLSGPIVGVDVSRGLSITAADIVRPRSMLGWVLSGQWRKGPPIVSLLIRAATVSSGRDLAAAREAADVLILPELAGVEIRDSAASEPAVAAGHAAAVVALDRIEGPLEDLRRRPSGARSP